MTLLVFIQFLGDSSKVTLKTSNSQTSGSKNDLEIQFKFPWGQETIEKIRKHGQTPIKQYEGVTDLKVTGKHGSKLVIPEMIECNTTIEAAIAAFICDALKMDEHHGSPNNVSFSFYLSSLLFLDHTRCVWSIGPTSVHTQFMPKATLRKVLI